MPVAKMSQRMKVVEEMADDRRKKLVEIKTDIDNKWVDFSVIASEVYDTKEYEKWGFDKAEKFAKADLGMEYRTFMNRVHMGRVIRSLGISKDLIQGIGASKFKEISLLLDESSTQKELTTLVEKAGKLPYRELQDYVRHVRLEKQGGEVVKKITMTFRFTDEQGEIVESALNDAISKFLLDPNDPMARNIAIENICEWFLLETEGKTIPESILKALSKHEKKEVKEVKVKHKKHAHAKKAVKKVVKKKKK